MIKLFIISILGVFMSHYLFGDNVLESSKSTTILVRKDKSYYLNGSDFGEGDRAVKKIINYLLNLPQDSCVIEIVGNNKEDFFQTEDKTLQELLRKCTRILRADKKIIFERIEMKEYPFPVGGLLLLRWYNINGDSTDTKNTSFFLDGSYCGKGPKGFKDVLERIRGSSDNKGFLIVGNQDYTRGLKVNQYPFGDEEEMELVRVLKAKGIKWLNRKRYSNQPISTLKEIKQPPLPKELTNVSILGEFNDVPHSTLINNINKLLRKKDLQVQIHWANSQMENKMIKHLEFEHTMISDVLRTIYIYDVRGKHIILKGIKE